MGGTLFAHFSRTCPIFIYLLTYLDVLNQENFLVEFVENL